MKKNIQKRCSLFIPIYIIGVLLALTACHGGKGGAAATAEGDTLKLKYARYLTIVDYGDYTEVILADPWHEGNELHRYLLVEKGKQGDETVQMLERRRSSRRHTDIVRTPVESSVVFTSPHCQLAYDLGCEQAISGVCDLAYINIPDIQRRAMAGATDRQGAQQKTNAGTTDKQRQQTHVADCGSSMNPSIEKIVELSPKAILVSPFQGSGGFGKLETLSIPLIETADYMETSALGRAEWMRFYGLLFGCSAKADSLFEAIDKAYLSLKVMAAKLPQGRSILTERKTGSVWYTPGGNSTIGALLRDAHAAYPFSQDKHSGSLNLSPEQMIDRASDVEVWAFKNFGKPLSRAALLEEYQGYKMLKAFQTGNIYQCDTSTTPFFEQTAFHPERLLREFIILSHPEARLGPLRYYAIIN